MSRLILFSSATVHMLLFLCNRSFFCLILIRVEVVVMPLVDAATERQGGYDAKGDKGDHAAALHPEPFTNIDASSNLIKCRPRAIIASYVGAMWIACGDFMRS